MATTEVIQEYLTRIGYVVDTASQKKAEEGLAGIGKRMFVVGKAVTGLMLAVSAATVAFAYSMRKMYYQSELSQSSVKNLNGMGYAFEQIGGASGEMENVVKHLASILRMNPGMKALAETFGVKVTGRDMSDVAVDLVNALGKMPHEVGARIAGQFGIGEEEFYMLKKNMAEFQAARAKMAGIYNEMGFNPDSAANKKVFKELTSQLDQLEARAKILGQSLMAAFAKPLGSLMTSIGEEFSAYSGIAQSFAKGDTGTAMELLGQELMYGAFLKSREETNAAEKQILKNSGKTKPSKEAAASSTVGALADYYNIPDAADLTNQKATNGAGSKQATRAMFGAASEAYLGTTPAFQSNVTLNQTNNITVGQGDRDTAAKTTSAIDARTRATLNEHRRAVLDEQRQVGRNGGGV